MSDFVFGMFVGMVIGPLLGKIFYPTVRVLWDMLKGPKIVIQNTRFMSDGMNGTPRTGKTCEPRNKV